MTSLSSGGAMLQRDDENEADVRREDQDMINEFASLNARLHEVRDEKESIKVGRSFRSFNHRILYLNQV